MARDEPKNDYRNNLERNNTNLYRSEPNKKKIERNISNVVRNEPSRSNNNNERRSEVSQRESPNRSSNTNLGNSNISGNARQDRYNNIQNSSYFVNMEKHNPLENEELFEPENEDVISELEVRDGLDSGPEVLASLGENANYGRKLPRIPVMINGQQILASIDTGASVHFVRPDVLGETDSPHPTVVHLGCENK
ncbi:hypothetical protein JTB14_031633 [Gonioctena quinquepunctata]|nr:hypothetical protein JTB14_031633 [Gonioctena quinquepunctata]